MCRKGKGECGRGREYVWKTYYVLSPLHMCHLKEPKSLEGNITMLIHEKEETGPQSISDLPTFTRLLQMLRGGSRSGFRYFFHQKEMLVRKDEFVHEMFSPRTCLRVTSANPMHQKLKFFLISG